MAGLYSKLDLGLLANSDVDEVKSYTIKGFNLSVSTNEEVLGSGSINFSSYTLASSTHPVTVVSDVSSDAGQIINVVYIDGNGDLQNGTITTNGTNPSDSSFTATRILRAYIVDGPLNSGELSFSLNGDSPMYMAEGEGATHTAVFTVPTGYVALPVSYSAANARNDQVRVSLRIRFAGTQAFLRTFNQIIAQQTSQQLFRTPIALPAGTDLVVTAQSLGGNSDVTGDIELLLLKEEVL